LIRTGLFVDRGIFSLSKSVFSYIFPLWLLMVTIKQTVDIPADRRLHLDLKLPETVPVGRTSVVHVFPAVDNPAVEDREPFCPRESEPFPTLEELKAEAAAKYAVIIESGVDPWQQFRESLQGSTFFGKDGMEYQRSMRDEWPD
jgi:hypothetical protein